MKQKQSILKLAALAVLGASCSDSLPELPPPCEGEGYSIETHHCRETRLTCEGKDGCVGIGANCEITSAEEEGHTYKVICEGEPVGYLDNGKSGEKGERGLDGANGEDCSIASTDEGVEITCGTLKLLRHGIIGEDGENGKPGENGEDGENGKDGTNGENCKIAPKGESFEITCGTVKLQLDHGTNGTDGTSTNGKNCTIDPTLTGVVIDCETVPLYYLNHGAKGEPGGKGDPGANGKGCTIVQTGKGVDITCDNVIPISLTHGEPGTDGSVITITDDGYWCIGSDTTAIKAAGDKGVDCTVEEKGNRFEMTCGTGDPETWPKTMPFFIDERDGKKYTYVRIGDQTWMAENLNYNAPGSECYEYLESNCDTYGKLYDWNTALTVCPAGWHLPSDAEWTALTDFVGGTSTAGTKLKAVDGWTSYTGITNDDKYGFSALPGGFGPSGGIFYDVGLDGGWWSATEYNSSNAYLRDMDYRYEDVYRGNDGKSYLYSVRCMRSN
jgi:uncharacterized protein (TIGR02145 family)